MNPLSPGMAPMVCCAPDCKELAVTSFAYSHADFTINGHWCKKHAVIASKKAIALIDKNEPFPTNTFEVKDVKFANPNPQPSTIKEVGMFGIPTEKDERKLGDDWEIMEVAFTGEIVKGDSEKMRSQWDRIRKQSMEITMKGLLSNIERLEKEKTDRKVADLAIKELDIEGKGMKEYIKKIAEEKMIYKLMKEKRRPPAGVFRPSKRGAY